VRTESPGRTSATSWIPIAAAALVVVGLVAAAYLFTRSSNGVSTASLLGGINSGTSSANLLGDMYPSEGRTHVTEGSPIQYQNVPPSSGSHYPSPKEWGVYADPIQPGYWVHNLEHGGVALLYNCPSGCPDVVSVGQDAFNTFPKDKYGEVKLVVTPDAGLPSGVQVAAVAWQYVKLYRGDFTRDNFLAFYNGHVDRGPEDIP
jgi:hypothetical protein